MRRRMVVVPHADDDTEENGERWHEIYARSVARRDHEEDANRALALDMQA